MRTFIGGFLFLLVAGIAISGGAQESNIQPTTPIRGWLSDSQCARGRAESGTYTGTNPRCAKECVAKGKKIVLIDPERKQIFDISNQALAKRNIGDYVEIVGEMDLQKQTVHIASLKMIEPGSASCERPKMAE